MDMVVDSSVRGYDKPIGGDGCPVSQVGRYLTGNRCQSHFLFLSVSDLVKTLNRTQKVTYTDEIGHINDLGILQEDIAHIIAYSIYLRLVALKRRASGATPRIAHLKTGDSQ